MSAHYLHYELCARARAARCWAGSNRRYGSRHDLHHRRGIALAAAFARERFMGLLARTESWRYRIGKVLEVGGSVTVLVFGVWMVVSSLTT